MIPASSSAAQPAVGDWRQAWRQSLTDPAELLRRLDLGDLIARLPATPPHGFAMRVPLPFLARMRRGDPADPLLRQVLPLDAENLDVAGFSADAVGDLDARVAPGVLHKYHGRALLVTTGACAVHCRYCFRRHFPYAEEGAAMAGWRAAVDALAADPSMAEVILSGGDPLALANSRLQALSDALSGVAHIRRLRIHTRLPVVLPQRVDRGLLAWLERLPWQRVVVLHVNHAREIDEQVREALSALAASGATLLNQAVLLRGVNDDGDTLAELSETLFSARVLPYYLHQLDPVRGAAHFQVDDRRARELHVALLARLPGYLVPRLVREIPGGASKTPL